MTKASCRKAFTSTLQVVARQRPDIWAVATDSRGSVTISPFFNELTEQSVELGIAEQNAVAVAAGISLTGKNVFVTGPAAFLAARSFEQVKVDVAYNEANVKIIGVSGGVSYGPLGGTHTSLHDIASMRALPNIRVYIPSDAVQASAVTKHLTDYKGPVYMRTGRGDVEVVYPEGEAFEMEKAKIIRDGSDAAIIACGEMVYHAKLAGDLLADRGINVRVIDMFCIKPLDAETIIKAARETKALVTVEEHSVFGGLGEAVAHIVVENAPAPMKILGFPDEEYKIGNSTELFDYYGLTAKKIAGGVLRLLEK
ncbi:MAG: transketolase family protein [Oscillospiraceae bacterium]|nr:transketolase family protein [Oscillospiraceae bacterium]